MEDVPLVSHEDVATKMSKDWYKARKITRNGVKIKGDMKRQDFMFQSQF